MTSKKKFKDPDIEKLAQVTAKGFADAEKRFDGIDKRFDKIDERFEKLGARIDGLGNQMDYLTDKVQITHNLMENDLLRRLAKLEKVVLHR